MRNFRDNRGGGGGGRFGKRSFGGDRGGYGGGGRGDRGDRRDGGRPSMHKATCSECGKECEVPFRPTGERPIFCSDCFGKQQSRGGAAPRERSFDRPRFENKRPDFRAAPAQDNKAINELKQQLEVMNNKLERILSMVMPAPAKKEKAVAVTITEEKTEKAPAKPKAKKAKVAKKKK